MSPLVAVKDTWYLRSGALKARGHPDWVAPSPPPAARFPGDPGVGRMFHGQSLNLGADGPNALDDFNTAHGTHCGITRRYFDGNTSMATVTAALNQDNAGGRLTWMSFKLPAYNPGVNTGWGQAVSGTDDAWWQSIADTIDATGRPAWVAPHHEPRGETGLFSSPTDWRNMIDYGADILHSSPFVTVATVLNGYAFAVPGGDLDPKGNWYTPKADIIGFDQYNQWWLRDPTGGSRRDGTHESWHPWNSPAKVFGPLLTIQGWGKPCAIAEYGVHYPWDGGSNPSGPMAGQWMTDAYNFALDNGAAGLVLFNQDQNSPRGGWWLHQYNKPPDYTIYAGGTERLTAFIANDARAESALFSERVG